MPECTSAGRLDEAADDLRRWQHRLTEVGERLDRKVDQMRWEGRGANRFREHARDRRGDLRLIAEQLQHTAWTLRQAADEVRDQMREEGRARS